MKRTDYLSKFNFLYFSKGIDLSYLKDRSVAAATCLFIVKSCYRIIYSLYHLRRHWGTGGKVIFYGYSESNLHALQDIYKSTNAKACFVLERYMVAEPSCKLFPKGLSALFSLCMLPISLFDFWMVYRTLDTLHKAHFRRGADSLLDTYGRLLASKLWLKWSRPSAIVTSCDHRYEDLIFFHLAQQKNIPTFYLQHASVNENFPPLSMDYALLDGRDALEKYQGINAESPTEIFLIGVPKFDKFKKDINNKEKVQRIGYALNGLEKLENVVPTCAELRNYYPDIELVVRPHPMLLNQAEFRTAYLAVEKKLKELPGVSVSDSRKQGVFEYLKEIDLLIAGDSNIHLEATLLNVYCIYYSDTENHAIRDWYGFIRNGLIDEARSVDHLINLIKNVVSEKPNVRYRAKRYCETVDTEMDGKSTSYAAAILSSKISDNEYPREQLPVRGQNGLFLKSKVFLKN